MTTPADEQQPGQAGEPTPAQVLEFLLDAARAGDEEDVGAAIAHPAARLDGVDAGGRTPLHMAAANGHLAVAKMLLAAGAAPDLKNADGNTPLHWACLNGHKEVVQALLEAGASAAVLNTAGRTPVDEALLRDFRDIVDAINACNSGAGIEVEVVEAEDEDGDGDDVAMEAAAQQQPLGEGAPADAGSDAVMDELLHSEAPQRGQPQQGQQGQRQGQQGEQQSQAGGTSSSRAAAVQLAQLHVT